MDTLAFCNWRSGSDGGDFNDLYGIFFKGVLPEKLGSANSVKRKMFFAIILVLGYSAHALFYFSDANAKSKNVQKEFTSLHPILRLSTSTILFLDGKLIMTDANRVPEDYKKMGLKSKKTVITL